MLRIIKDLQKARADLELGDDGANNALHVKVSVANDGKAIAKYAWGNSCSRG